MSEPTSAWKTDAIPAIDKSGVTLPDIIRLTDFMATPLPNPPVLVDGMIHQGTQVMLAGASKAGKTWVLSDLALSVAAGVPWWGRETQKGRVLYINLEIGPSFYQDRMSSLLDAKNLEAIPKEFDVWNLRGYTTDINALVPELVKRCEQGGYALILPDPIYKLLGSRSENDASEITDFFKQLETIACKTGAAVVFAHHFAKGSAADRAQIDRFSGSGVFARFPDGIITLMGHKEEGAYIVEASVRNFAPVTPFVVRWSHPLMQIDPTLNPGDVKSKVGRPAMHSNADILSCLTEGMTKAEWTKAAEAAGISKSTLHERVKKLGASVESYTDGKAVRWKRKNTVVSFQPDHPHAAAA